MFLATFVSAQEVIPLYPGTPPGSRRELSGESLLLERVEHGSRQQRDPADPHSIQAFSGVEKRARGGDLPGGGFMALSIASEGADVAKYLAERGITAFVLKYRLAHTGDDATQEFADACPRTEKKF